MKKDLFSSNNKRKCHKWFS